MTPVLLLVAQTVLAGAGLLVLARRVLPAAGAGDPALVADVLGPLAVVLPLLVPVLAVRANVAGAGWLPLGAPVVIATLAAGLALARRRGPGPVEWPGAALHLALAGTGVLLLMLGAAHDLTIWTGQAVFAVAAVVLWMNTPAAGRAEEEAVGTDAGAGGGLALTAAVACAAGQGTAAALAGPSARGASATIALAYAVIAVAIALRRAGPALAVRITGWGAVLGTLLAIGTLSTAQVLPQAAAIVAGRDVEVHVRVAHSFGAYVPEAVLLLALPAALWLAPGLAARARRLVAATLLAVAGILLVVRLAGIWIA
jgi:hypothetical protein